MDQRYYDDIVLSRDSRLIPVLGVGSGTSDSILFGISAIDGESVEAALMKPEARQAIKDAITTASGGTIRASGITAKEQAKRLASVVAEAALAFQRRDRSYCTSLCGGPAETNGVAVENLPHTALCDAKHAANGGVITCPRCGCTDEYERFSSHGRCQSCQWAECREAAERTTADRERKAAAKARRENLPPERHPPRGWDARFSLLGALLAFWFALGGCGGTPTDHQAPPAKTRRLVAVFTNGVGIYAVVDPTTAATIYFSDDSRGGIAVLPADNARQGETK